MWPTAFEAGTPNTPALFGLAAALDWLEQHHDLSRSIEQIDRIRAALTARGDTTFFGPAGDAPRLPILSFLLAGMHPIEVGALLAEASIEVRSGFHCAPWIHRRLGTEADGTVRISVGPLVEDAAIEAACSILTAL